MNENEVSGPCRKVGRSRKRSLTPYYPYDHDQLTDQEKASQLDTTNTQCQEEVSILSQKQINGSQIGSLSARNGDVADNFNITHTSNNTNEIWFSNSFVRSRNCDVGKKSTSHQQNNCQGIESVPKKIRLDVDFSQRSQSDDNNYNERTANGSVRYGKQFSGGDHEKKNGNFHQDRKESHLNQQTVMADTSVSNNRDCPHLFHSTPIKNLKEKTGLGKTEMVSRLTETEDMLNNSDHVLAGLDMADDEEKTDIKTVTKGDNSHKSEPSQSHLNIRKCNRLHGNSNVTCDKLTKGRISEDCSQMLSMIHIDKPDVSKNMHDKCTESPQSSDRRGGYSTESRTTTVHSKETIRNTKCTKHHVMNISDDDIFAHDSDFLSEIESLERKADTATDKRAITEKINPDNTTSHDQLVLEQNRKNRTYSKSCDTTKLGHNYSEANNCDKRASENCREKTAGSVTNLKGQGHTDMTSPLGTKVRGQDVNTPEVSSTMKTPTSIGLGGSLKDRIKRRLQENASTKLVESPGAVMEQRREGEITVATTKAEQIKKDGSDIDVGPFFGLSSKVKALLQQHRGIDTLYAWQNECLNLPAVLEGKNLIYSLPTSGGKTLVAEILIMRELLCKKRDAILILPFVSIVQEKVRGLSPFGIDLDFLVEEYAGSKGKFPPLKSRKRQSLYIATIEKAHSLVNSLIENNRLDSLGLVVVDELHMIGEGGSRGATLESTLLKVIYTQKTTQIVGMSATLSNTADLQTFLGAEVYSNSFRPVELTEYAKLQDNIYQVNPKAKCPEDQLVHDRVVMFKYSPDMTRVDGDHLLGLVLEVIPDKSCLLFCPTKKNCENVAMMLCKLLVKHHHELSLVKKTERKALLKELYNDGAGKICPVLQYTLHFGVAYHHSGLTTDERRLIEDAYADGTLCLLTCTSTLAAGVNLPAKRVILRSPYVGSQFISRSQYKQMVGRAGRAGIDSTGESILITKSSDTEKVGELLTAPMEVCHSSLMHDDGKGIRGLLLSAVGLQMTKTTREVFACMEKTLLSVQASRGVPCDIVEVTRQALQQLVDLGLVTQKRALSQETDEDLHHLEVTTLGRATFKGSVNLDWSGRLYTDLHQGEESLVLSSHLHLLYLVTPYDMVSMVKPSWIVYFQEMSTLNPVELKMAALIGVPEGYITRKASGQNSRQKVDDFVVGRFYLTLMLYGLWKQRTVWEVSDKFQQTRGFIQNLLSSAASFASCVYHFCQELDEFWPYQDLFGNFVQRLSYCVSPELIPLMEIPGVKLGRAKQMYSVGYRTLAQVANADPENLVKKIKQIPRKIAQQIVTAAKMLLNEKAEALWQEVEELVMVPEAASSHPSPDLSSQGSIASSDILAYLTDWGD
ncbi:helicase POLQ-like isoform X1 [Mizuhopecten yessoensis]|uniref:helicase POLQ-like isoform X1 n=1 Tax=Mizuhopecten yessoensis TaxID=6573 RepID=UPI000B45D73E|nr:helicase POLQ-like isoform X1 [Mizuhopecten yessoensis]